MIRAELLKLTTTTAPKIAVAVGVAGLLLTQAVLVTVLPALASGAIGPGRDTLGDIPSFALDTAAAQLAALNPLGSTTGAGSIGIAVIAVLILGVLAGTTDYRYGGMVPTALARPRRVGILLAKTAATGVVGLVVGVVYAAVSLVALVSSLPIAGSALVVGPVEMGGVLLRGAVVVALLTLVGLAVGVVTRSQLAGVLVILAVLVLELVVQSIVVLVTGSLPLWAQLGPLSLGQAAVSSGAAGALPPLVALAALAGLTAVLLAAAGAALRRRDI